MIDETRRVFQAGKRLLPQVVEELAADDPEAIWMSVPVVPGSAANFRDVTYSQLTNAINRTAWWIDSHIKGATSDSQTLAYLGPTDSRYFVFLIAAIKAGRRLLLPSTRNAEHAQCSLLKATNCTTLLCAHPELQKAKEVLTALEPYPCAVYVVPEQDEILDNTPVREYVYQKSFEDERFNPFVILHTSGTTGDLVPIELPHSYYAYEDAYKAEFMDAGITTFAVLRPGSRCLYTGPLYHAGAILFTLLKGLLLKVPMILTPAGVPVTAMIIESCIVNGRADMLGTAPSVLEDLCSSPTGAECLRGLEAIFCGSGPMPKRVSDFVMSAGPDFYHIYGSTETALLPQLPVGDLINDKRYFRFHPASGVGFRTVGKDGLHELIIHRLPGDVSQPCFTLFPNLKEYHTNDTFSAHASQPGLWKFEGRVDDIITLTNGEKFCPLGAEQIIAGHAQVAEALIVGQARFQPALLLNMHDASKRVGEVLDDLWPLIEEVNAQAPGYARIGNTYVLVSKIPFPKTPKGSVRRHRTEELLQSEINDLYKQSGHSYESSNFAIDMRSVSSIQHTVEQAVSSELAQGLHVEPDADLFVHGLDSLKAAELASLLNSCLSMSATSNARLGRVDPAMIYQNRSMSRLATALHALLNSHDSVAADRAAWQEDHKILLQRYTKDLPKAARLRTRNQKRRRLSGVVMLTGSTGYLGSNMLHGLLQDANTAHVYCLDRSSRAQPEYLKTFPFDEHLLRKVTFLCVPQVDADNLGLVDSLVYEHLLKHVSTIVHNAWPVDFNIPVVSSADCVDVNASFEPHLAALRRLIDFTARASRRPQLVLISSLASVSGCVNPAKGRICESVNEDPSAPLANGYARSKWLAERMLGMAAARNPQNRFKIIRLGQIGGSTHDARMNGNGSIWPINELIPSMIRSSATIRALPVGLPCMEKIRWVAVDIAAAVILEIISHERENTPTMVTGAITFNVTDTHSRNGRKNMGRYIAADQGTAGED